MSSLTDQIIARLKELRDKMRYYGLFLGGALILVELMQYFQLNNITAEGILFFSIFKIATLFYVSSYLIKRIKKEFFKTGMSYAQSFSTIFRLFLYASLFVGIYTFVFNQWLVPEYQADSIEKAVNYMNSSLDKFPIPAFQKQYIETIIEQIEDAPTPTPMAIMWNKMWVYLIWGTVVGLILSIFTRDKDVTPWGKQETQA